MREIALATLDKRPNESFHAVFCFVADCASLVWPDLKVDLPKAAPIEDAVAQLAPEPRAEIPEGLTSELETKPTRVLARERVEALTSKNPGQPGPGVEAEADSPAAVQQAEEESEADALQAGEVSASPATRLPAPVRPARRPWQAIAAQPPKVLGADLKPAAVPPPQPEPAGETIGWTPAMEEDMRRMRLDEGRGWNEVALQMGKSPNACQVRATEMKKRDKWFRKVTDRVLTSGGGGSSLGQVI